MLVDENNADIDQRPIRIAFETLFYLGHGKR
jgi:hypothetical protein